MINWLASYPKSGNTWARMLLSAYHYDGRVNIDDTVVTADIGLHMYQGASIKPLFRMSGKERVLIRYAALINLYTMTRYRPLVVKTHFANIEVHDVRMIPPAMSSRSIYLVRDPRDVAPSFARHIGKSLDEIIECMADEKMTIGSHDDEIQHFLSTWSNHVKSWQGFEGEVTLVRYEDMKADPGDALERMLVTCNVVPDPERIDRAVEATEIGKLSQQEDERGFSEQSRKAGKFFGATRETLSESQRREVENAHGQMMAEMGY